MHFIFQFNIQFKPYSKKNFVWFMWFLIFHVIFWFYFVIFWYFATFCFLLVLVSFWFFLLFFDFSCGFFDFSEWFFCWFSFFGDFFEKCVWFFGVIYFLVCVTEQHYVSIFFTRLWSVRKPMLFGYIGRLVTSQQNVIFILFA